jgi:hypothetical protein
VVKREEMAAVVTDYFAKLFSSRAGTRIHELLPHVPEGVTPEMNDFLLRDFQAARVKQALDSIRDLKAPGLDGMPSIFFRTNCEVVGEMIVQEVLKMLHAGDTPRGGTIHGDFDTKGKNSGGHERSHPISLCNVLYELVSKVFDNHLKSILSDIIAQTRVCLCRDG